MGNGERLLCAMHARTPGNSRNVLHYVTNLYQRHWPNSVSRRRACGCKVKTTRRRGCGDQRLSINSLMDEATDASCKRSGEPAAFGGDAYSRNACSGRESLANRRNRRPCHRKANDCETQYQVIWFFSTRDLFSFQQKIAYITNAYKVACDDAREACAAGRFSFDNAFVEILSSPASPILKVRLRHHNGRARRPAHPAAAVPPA